MSGIQLVGQKSNSQMKKCLFHADKSGNHLTFLQCLTCQPVNQASVHVVTGT